MVEHLADLGRPEPVSPQSESCTIGQILIRSPALALDPEESSQRGGLARDPGRIGRVAEPRVVGHDGEDVEVREPEPSGRWPAFRGARGRGPSPTKGNGKFPGERRAVPRSRIARNSRTQSVKTSHRHRTQAGFV